MPSSVIPTALPSVIPTVVEESLSEAGKGDPSTRSRCSFGRDDKRGILATAPPVIIPTMPSSVIPTAVEESQKVGRGRSLDSVTVLPPSG